MYMLFYYHYDLFYVFYSAPCEISFAAILYSAPGFRIGAEWTTPPLFFNKTSFNFVHVTELEMGSYEYFLSILKNWSSVIPGHR